MKKKALYTDIFREIRKTLGRFISIALLIAIAVFVFTGLSITGPDIVQTTAAYLQEFSVADAVVQSTYGLDELEQEKLRKDTSLEAVEFIKETEVLLVETGQNIKVQSAASTLSQYEVVEGRLPERTTEITLDAMEQGKTHNIGDIITLQDHSKDSKILKETSYTVVGFARSPEYIVDANRGTSTAGNGTIDAFAVVMPEVLDMEVYTSALVRFKSTQGLQLYTKAYEEAVDQGISALEKTFENMPVTRIQEVKKESTEKIADGYKELADGRKKLKDAEKELLDGEAKLESGKIAYQDGVRTAEAKMQDAEALLAEMTEQLNQGKKQLEDGQQQVNQNSALLAEEKEQLLQKEQEVSSGLQAVEDGLVQVTIGIQTLESSILELQQQREQLAAQRPQMDGMMAQLQSQLSAVAANIIQLETDIQVYIDAGQEVPETLYDELASAKIAEQELQVQIGMLQAQMDEVDAGFPQMTATQVYLENELITLKQTEKELQENKKMLVEAMTQIEQGKQMLLQGELELQAAQQQIDSQKEKLVAGEVALQEGRRELEAGRVQMTAALQTAYAELQEAIQTFEEAQTLFQTEKVKAEKEFQDGEKELQDAQTTLDELKDPLYIFTGRTANASYVLIGDSRKGLAVLGIVVPMFIFFVAMLVSLTTMSRMVDEQRMQIGTLKSLGYKNSDIRKKYIIYGFAASTCGIIIGILAGHYVLPKLIFAAYQDMFTFRPFTLYFSITNTLIACVVSYTCTVGIAYVISNKLLKENTAQLMRGPAPTSGARILLERIPFIWKKMSFTYKVTFRNLFRYKQRMLMTIIGVAGCAALIIMGIGLFDSIGMLSTKQFEEINQYDVLVAYDNESDDAASLHSMIQGNSGIERKAEVLNRSFTSQVPGVSQQTISVVVPDDMDEFKAMTFVAPRKQKVALDLNTSGVVISEKLATIFKLKPGDTLTLQTLENETYEVPIGAITQEYAEHKVYMNQAEYEKIFNDDFEPNAYMLSLQDNSKEDVEAFATKMKDQPAVIMTFTTSDMKDAVADLLKSMQSIIYIIILIACLLALVVLYNLTNINVAERERELSTIKVLGFYDKEVTAYIYRETFILTCIGIVVGFIPGLILHAYICKGLPPAAFMFPMDIKITNYLLTIAFTLIVSIGVMFVMHRKMKNVDMVEALKSVE